jgi:hypothetical protein
VKDNQLDFSGGVKIVYNCYHCNTSQQLNRGLQTPLQGLFYNYVIGFHNVVLKNKYTSKYYNQTFLVIF